jgi:raffinose/stachyose/melibiose transport system permease protein
LGVFNFSSQYSQDVAPILAYTALSMVPALVFYVFAERQLIGGLTSGAVKG